MQKRLFTLLLILCVLVGALPVVGVSAATGATTGALDTFELADGNVVTVTKLGSKEGKINTDEDVAAVSAALPAHSTNLLAASTTTNNVPSQSIYGRSLNNMLNGSVIGNGHWIENPNKDVLLVFDLHAVKEVYKFFLSTEAGWNGYTCLNNVNIYLSADVEPTDDTLNQCTLVHTISDTTGYALYAARTVELAAPIKARYIAFQLGCHNYLGGYGTQVAAIGELGAYAVDDGSVNYTGATTGNQDIFDLGEGNVLTVDKYTKEQTQNSLPTEANLLSVDKLTATGVTLTNARSNSHLTDGSIATSGMSAAHYVDSVGGLLTYNLGSVAAIDKLYLCSAQDHQNNQSYWMANIEVYYSKQAPTNDNLGTLLYKISDNNNTSLYPARLLTLSEAIEAQYITFKLDNNGTNNAIYIGELGVYGTTKTQTGVATNGAKDTFDLGDGITLRVLKYTKEETADSLPTKTNLLNMAALTTNGVTLTNNRSHKHLTDGSIATSGMSAAHYIDSDGGLLTYDFGAVASIEELYLCSSQDWQNNQSYWMYNIEVYISNTAPTADDLGTKVYTIDDNNHVAMYPTRLLTFSEPVEAQYVTFKLSNNGLNNHILIGELGAYGTIPEGPVAQITKENMAEKVPATNLMGTAVMVQGTHTYGTPSVTTVTDGLIYDYNTTDENNKTSFTGDTIEGGVKTASGKTVPNVTEMATVAFRLEGVATVESLLVAGSLGDGTNFQGTGVNNRHVLYYEIYLSDKKATLFDESNRVVAYENFAAPMLAQLHALEEPKEKVHYIGYKLTCGAYKQARIGELGVYGEMREPAALSYAPFDDQATMDALVNGQTNLLKGEAVEPKPSSRYLSAECDRSIADQKYLTDGMVNWTGTDNVAYYANGDGSIYRAKNDDTISFSYDLRGMADVKGILLSNAGGTVAADRIQKVSIYVSDDKAERMSPAYCVGTLTWDGASTGAYIDLSSYNVVGRYVSFAFLANANASINLAELAVYGTYTSDIEPYPLNLVQDALPVEEFQLPARGFDNITAVDKDGNPGTGNTGAITYPQLFNSGDDTANLTDGDIYTRVVKELKNMGTLKLEYNTQWATFVYHLGGESTVDRLELTNTYEPLYYTGGVQYYASYYYKDLFKNESLLYTTGGEHFMEDANGNLVPDPAYDVTGQRVFEYELTAEQKANQYRYVALVITRPYTLEMKNDGTYNGHNRIRTTEFMVEGTRNTVEEPMITNFTTEVEDLGTVTMNVAPINYDDRTFIDSIGGFRVTKEKLPEGVKNYTEAGWLSMDSDTVYHVQIVDVNGNPIPDTHEDMDKGMNGREVEFIFPTTTDDYLQTMGVIRGKEIQRLYNSFSFEDGTIMAGALDYPRSPDGVNNHRDLATLASSDLQLVFLKANEPLTVDELNMRQKNMTLEAFTSQADVAGAAEATMPSVVLPIAIAAGLLLLLVVGLWLYRRGRRNEQ